MKFEEFRYVGDKRTQVVYDLDTDDAAVGDTPIEVEREARRAGELC